MARNLEPGMDDPQAQADRKGWQTTVASLTGAGEANLSYEDRAGPEVGNNYDIDPLGEEYSPVTYTQSTSQGSASAGPSAQEPRGDKAGKTTASAPQNYSNVAK
jgi:hypothetical protein